MRRVGISRLGWVVMLGVLGVVGAGVSAAEPGAEVTLRWAMGTQGVDGTAARAITADTRLDAGQRLKLLVEPVGPAAVYVILRDADKGVHVLHREWADGNLADDSSRTYIPSGSQWIELDHNGGPETFFLLAATQPLSDLDRLLDDYDVADDATRAKLGPGVIEEIRRQQKLHRKFSRKSEKPVLLGGRTRGQNADDSAIDSFAVEVTAEVLFGKTITIEH